jgi:hypothetical protein
MLCLPYYAYVFSSTKFVIKAEQDLPGSEGGGGEWVVEGVRGKDEPNNYALVNK